MYVSNVSYGNVVLRISYSTINDLEILSRARLIVEHFSLWNPMSSMGEEYVANFNKSNIAILKITIKLINQGYKVMYYKTNYACGVSLHVNEAIYKLLKPLTWSVKEPVTLIHIENMSGYILPLPVFCTDDLRFKPIPPRAEVVNEFYYIVTVPFEGVIKAVANICTQPQEFSCKPIENTIYVKVTSKGFTVIPPPKAMFPEQVLKFLSNISNIRKLISDPKVTTLLRSKGINPELLIEDVKYSLSLGMVEIARNPKTHWFKSYVLSIQLVKLGIGEEEKWVTGHQYLSIVKNGNNTDVKCLEQLVIKIYYNIEESGEIRVVNIETIDLPVCLVELQTHLPIPKNKVC